MKTITLKADTQLDATLSRLALSEGKTKSAIIREAIVKYDASIERAALMVQMRKASYLVREQSGELGDELIDSLDDGF